MGVLYGFLVLVEMVVCALLIIVIFMQKTKGGMGGTAFGGGAGEAIFGSRMGNVLTKSTVVLGVVFLLNTLLLTVLTTQRGLGGGSVMEAAARRPAAQQPQQQPMPGLGDDPAAWMDMDMQPAADVPVPMDIPVTPVETDPEDVIQIPPAVEMVVPEGVEDAEPVVLPDYDIEPSAVPEGPDPDLGE